MFVFEFNFTDTFVFLGGVPFIEQQGEGSAELPVSDSAASSISSPTADSGLSNCSKATSKDDLTDLEGCSTATTPSTATSTYASMLDTQVKLNHFQQHCG